MQIWFSVLPDTLKAADESSSPAVSGVGLAVGIVIGVVVTVAAGVAIRFWMNRSKVQPLPKSSPRNKNSSEPPDEPGE